MALSMDLDTTPLENGDEFIHHRSGGCLSSGSGAGEGQTLRREFAGLREHMAFTPDSTRPSALQLAGNRHDIQGLYAILETSFRGSILADKSYWPMQDKRVELEETGITGIARARGELLCHYEMNVMVSWSVRDGVPKCY
jgi:hypothetical protein